MSQPSIPVLGIPGTMQKREGSVNYNYLDGA
jgi:hypothetical protein